MKIVKKQHWLIELILFVVIWFAIVMAFAWAVSYVRFLQFLGGNIFQIVVTLIAGVLLIEYFRRQIKYAALYSLDTRSDSPRVKVPGLELIYERKSDVVIVKEEGRPELRFPRPDLHYAFNNHESTSNDLYPLVETGMVNTPNGLKPTVIIKEWKSVPSTSISGHSIELRFTPSEFSKFMVEERSLSTPKNGNWKAKVYTKTGVLEKAAIEKMNVYIRHFFEDTADYTEEWLLNITDELIAAKLL